MPHQTKLLLVLFFLFYACEDAPYRPCPIIPDDSNTIIDNTIDCLIGTHWVYHPNTPGFFNAFQTVIYDAELFFLENNKADLLWSDGSVNFPRYYIYNKPHLILREWEFPQVHFGVFAYIIEDTMYSYFASYTAPRYTRVWWVRNK